MEPSIAIALKLALDHHFPCHYMWSCVGILRAVISSHYLRQERGEMPGTASHDLGRRGSALCQRNTCLPDGSTVIKGHTFFTPLDAAHLQTTLVKYISECVF